MKWPFVSRRRCLKLLRRVIRHERVKAKRAQRLYHAILKESSSDLSRISELECQLAQLRERLASTRGQLEDAKSRAQSLRTAKGVFDSVQRLKSDLEAWRMQLGRIQDECRKVCHRIGSAYEIDDALRN